MFPDLLQPLPPTVSPTTNTWNKVDQDIVQHTYNIHYDLISKLQNEVKDLSTKVVQFEEKIKNIEMTQRTHYYPTPTTTTNNAHVTAKKNAIVRYYATPPVRPLRPKNPYLKKKKIICTSV